MPAPVKVKVPPKATEPVPVFPAVEMEELARSALATEPSKISVEPTPPVLIEATPAAVEKLEEENWTIPLAVVEALSIVTVVPEPDELARVKAPAKPSSEVTPAL